MNKEIDQHDKEISKRSLELYVRFYLQVPEKCKHTVYLYRGTQILTQEKIRFK